jgi:hypothetical protein
MKIKLLLLFCTTTFLLQAQAPISNYFSANNSQFETVSSTIDQSPTGANATWGFGTLTSTGTNIDTFAAPTAAQLAGFPGTTQVLTVTDDAMNTNDAFFKVVGSDLSLTGANNPQFSLDYNTDNAFIGTYPLTFGTGPTVDNIAGQITAQGQTANYTGTVTSEVDGYGSLSFNVVGQVAFSGNVTRVKTVQSISFTIINIFPGNASITTYNYYDDSDGTLLFRTSEGTVVVPGLAISESFSSAEAATKNTLSVDDNQLLTNTLTIYPNPAQDVLYIEFSNSQSITSVQVMDMNGRMVLTNNGTKNIDITALQAGFYVVAVATEKGTVIQKFIKK